VTAARSAAAPLTAAVLALALYWPTLGYGFHYDDYHFVRPYTTADIAAAFHGPWDTAGIETAYYRPLTICLYALRFAWLGLNAHANHAGSLALFAAAGALFALFVLRVTRSLLAALLAAAAFGVHPGMPYSATVWVTNQMHLAELLAVLGAAVWWFHVRARGAAWWMPLLLLQAAAFLIKEDGIMLIPAILVLHALRRWLVERGLRWPPLAFLVATAAVGGALLLLRSAALSGVPAHRLPSLDQAWTNWTRGFDSAFRLLPAKRPWQWEASWFATAVPLLAAILWRRLSPSSRYAMVSGLAVGILFLLPFAFIIKPEQLHIVTMGAALLLSGALAGLFDAVPPPRAWRLVPAGIAVAGLAAMATVARDITRDFEPFGPVVLRTDRIVEEWAAVPAELREYLADKRTPVAADRPDPDPSRALPVVAYGLHGRERSPDGRPLRWMAGPVADVYVRGSARLITFSARHERGAFREPAHVRIEADGRSIADAVLDNGDWHEFDVALRQRAWMGLNGMHHLRIRLDRAWVPAQIIAGSSDGRTLGLQLSDFQVR
jgi:hypothetical protein